MYDKCKKLKEQYYKEGRKLAIENKNNWDFIAGCMLYAAEGHKKRVRINNCDIKVIKLVKNFLQKYFNVENKDFRMCFNYFENHNILFEDIKKYWLDKLDLTEECLWKSTIKSNNSKKVKYPYGVCYLSCLSYRNTKRYQQLIGAIDEIFSGNNFSPEFFCEKN